MFEWGTRLRARGAAPIGLGLVSALLILAALTDLTAANASDPPTGRSATSIQRAGPGAPNIVMILTDDQSLADLAVMPKVLRKLGSKGTTFTNAFSPYPLCCPARATLLTGQYAQNHHVLGNHPPWGGFKVFDDSATLPTWLQQAGYNTIMMGKYLNGYPGRTDRRYVPPGWNEWHVPTKDIYNYRHWTLNENGVSVRHHGYQTSFVANQAVSMIDQYAADDAPFFMWAGFLAPHWGRPRERDDPNRLIQGFKVPTPNVAKKYRNSLSFLPLPDKKSINEANVSDKPDYVATSSKIPVALLRELNQQRKESLLSVDDAVGDILDELKAQGELKNTVLIFTSDNGFLTGEHRRVGKIIGYEESVRVPLIVAGPGFDTGDTRSQMVSLVDIPSTIASIAGANPQVTQDGVPLQFFVGNPNTPDQRAMLFQAGPPEANPVPNLTNRAALPTSDRLYVGIRTDRFVYLEYATGERELYDLQRDPLELVNRVDRPAFAKTQQKLVAALAQLRDCAGASCLLTVNELANR